MSCSFSFSKSNSCCLSSICFNPNAEKITNKNDIFKWTDHSGALSDAQALSFLDQTYPEPRLLRIECERLKINRPFVRADRDPAYLGMGFAPSAIRRRSTAFVDINTIRPSGLNPKGNHGSPTSFRVHMKT